MGAQFCESNLEAAVIERLIELGYPPDYTEEAIKRVIDQAEFMM